MRELVEGFNQFHWKFGTQNPSIFFKSTIRPGSEFDGEHVDVHVFPFDFIFNANVSYAHSVNVLHPSQLLSIILGDWNRVLGQGFQEC